LAKMLPIRIGSSDWAPEMADIKKTSASTLRTQTKKAFARPHGRKIQFLGKKTENKLPLCAKLIAITLRVAINP
jgi:hypothetical protein